MQTPRWMTALPIVLLAALALVAEPDAMAGEAPSATQHGVHKPFALHPDNPHYFMFRNKPTVLIASGEHYGAVLNLEFDYVRYLDELQNRGLNHTKIFSGIYHETPASFGIVENTLAPSDKNYLCPWLRSETPGNAQGGAKFDLTKFDPAYFARLADFMTQASRRGIVVEFNLFCTNYDDGLWKVNPLNIRNNVNGIGDCLRTEVYTLKHADLLKVQDAVTRKIMQELRGFDNLYYEICNEPYFAGVTMEWQNHIADVIAESEKDFGETHLISMNVANGSKKIEDPNRLVSIFNFHYCVPPNAVGMNYAMNKVIGDSETGFKGSADVTYRTEGWNFILAGGALYNNLDYSFTPSHPDGSSAAYKAPGGGSATLRGQLQILKRFVDSFDFIRMAPSDQVVLKSPTPKDMTIRTLAEKGRQYAVYIKGGKTASIEIDLPAGKYLAEWLDTKTGKIDKTETLNHAGGNVALQSPVYVEDIALSVKAVP